MLILQAGDFLILKFLFALQAGLVDTPVFAILSVFRFIHFHRNDLEIVAFISPFPCHGIFHPHDIVFIFLQMRRDSHREQGTFLECLPDRFVEAFPRHEELVIPDGDIPELFVLMDQAHQPLRVLPVLFPVA